MTHFDDLTATVLTVSVFGVSYGVLAAILYTLL